MVPKRIQVRALKANPRRRTDKGLSSATGASSANHERVLGKRRLRTWACEGRGLLVAELTLGCGEAHLRHREATIEGDITYIDSRSPSHQTNFVS